MIIYLAGRKYPVKGQGENDVRDVEKTLLVKHGVTNRLQTFYYQDTLDGYIQLRKDIENGFQI